MKVLVVEDDETARDYMVMTIESLGHETFSANDGVDGLKAFKTTQPDVVFSDIQMPNMDGLELLEHIRKADADVLIIMYSALDTPEYILKALRLKANDYLVKPVSAKAIVNILEKYADVLENRTRAREVLGLIYRHDLGMEISNKIDLLSKVVDRLMLETENALCPNDRLGIHLGLMEILVNAIEHGNLAITYAEKTQAMEGALDEWESLINSRLGAQPYKDRKVNIDFHMNRERCEWLITDQGAGFAWNELPDPNAPENLVKYSHGRGIMLAKLQFDEFTYLGSGNQIRLTKHLSKIP